MNKWQQTRQIFGSPLDGNISSVCWHNYKIFADNVDKYIKNHILHVHALMIKTNDKIIIDKETGDKTANVAHKPNLFGTLWVVISPSFANTITRNFMKKWINILV